MKKHWHSLMRRVVRALALWQYVAIEEVARKQNRFVYSPRVNWWADRAWAEPYRDFLQHDALPDAGTDETRILDRRFGLVQFAKAVQKLPGSTAECGVFKGVGSGIICTALQNTYADGECHFAFDSFEGLPAPTNEDRDRNRKSHWQAGQLATPEEFAAGVLSRFPNCRLVKGWIPDSLQVAADHRFRLVHIDVDLYKPTLDTLRFFYSRLVPQGLFVIDDYGLISCPGTRQAVLEFFADKPEAVLEVTAGQAVIMKS